MIRHEPQITLGVHMIQMQHAFERNSDNTIIVYVILSKRVSLKNWYELDREFRKNSRETQKQTIRFLERQGFKVITSNLRSAWNMPLQEFCHNEISEDDIAYSFLLSVDENAVHIHNDIGLVIMDMYKETVLVTHKFRSIDEP